MPEETVSPGLLLKGMTSVS